MKRHVKTVRYILAAPSFPRALLCLSVVLATLTATVAFLVRIQIAHVIDSLFIGKGFDGRPLLVFAALTGLASLLSCCVMLVQGRLYNQIVTSVATLQFDATVRSDFRCTVAGSHGLVQNRIDRTAEEVAGLFTSTYLPAVSAALSTVVAI